MVRSIARNESSCFNYLVWDGKFEREKPFELIMDLPIDSPAAARTNITFQPGLLERIRDVRGQESSLSLDENGFMYRPIEPEPEGTDFSNRHWVEQVYLPQVVEPFFKKHIEGADSLFFFDWHLRLNTPNRGAEHIDINDGSQPLLPVHYVHVDQSPFSAIGRVRLHLKDEADQLLKGRVRIINFWKPLNHAVEDAPLAHCDGKTVNDSDIVVADHIRRDYQGEMIFLKWKEGYQLNYLSRQTPGEVTFFKNFDSDASVPAIRCPHSSFLHKETPSDSMPRESIEIRALVYTKPVMN